MKAYKINKIEALTLSESDVLTASNGTPFLPYSRFDENSGEQEL